MKLSKRVQELQPSATLAMAARARQMRADGVDVISFATGEPDFVTPANICAAAKRAIDAGETHYTPTAGIPELREAIRGKLVRDNGLDYADDEVTVTCGAKQAIYNALQALIDPNDEVLVPAPYWVSYPDQVRLAGGAPVILPTDETTAFKITPDQLRDAITERTRAILLCSPSNPSGSAYTREELAALGALLAEREIAIISDEIYEKLVYDGFTHTSIAAAHPPARERTILINGVSKAYAMTGWRMGYAAGPAAVIKRMTMLAGQQTTGLPAFVQAACVEALTNADDEVERMRAEFAARRDLMLERLRALPGVRCHVPQGAFYLLPNVEAFFGARWRGKPIDDATALAGMLLEEARIAVVSGDPFGAPGHIRLSYATSREQIEEGVRRMAEALRGLEGISGNSPR